jgi:1-aminocyclopropane-1-carboxylate deaminase
LVFDPFLEKMKVELLVKREDLIHPELGGNKWRKLKYNLEEARTSASRYLVTFGGAYSNHIFAVAAAGKYHHFQTIGFIRGEEALPLNPTLRFARSCGMELRYLDRHSYRKKEEPDFLKSLEADLPEKIFWVPEGGTNVLALKGVEEMAHELRFQTKENPVDFVAVAAGTGGTAAGLIRGLSGETTRTLVFPALKGTFMADNISKWLDSEKSANWEISTDYHFGGFARFNDELIDFINKFKAHSNIPLDPLYTGKLFFGLYDLIRKGYFQKGTRILAVHTGGLQGIAGFNERFGQVLDE